MKVNVTGLVCPLPVRVVRDHLDELSQDDEMVVVGDYPPAEQSIRRACLKHGYDVSREQTDDESKFVLRIRRTALSSFGSKECSDTVE